MPFPDGTPTVTLVGTIPSAVGGDGYTGRLILTPSAELIDSQRHAVYPGGGTVDIVDGTFSVQVIPTNAAGIQPTGWAWYIDLQPAGGKRLQFWADIQGANGSTIQFDSLVPIPAPGGGPSDGGGGGAVDSVNGQTGTVSLDAADVGADPAGAATAAQAAAIAAAATDATTKASAAQNAATSAAATDAASKVSAHVAASDPHGDRAFTTSAVSTHAGAADPHGDRAAAATDATSKVSAHTGASDPHGDRTFTTSAISTHAAAADPHGDRAFTTSAVSTHAGAADPHGDRAAAAADATAKAATAQAAAIAYADGNFVTSRPGVFRQRDLPPLINPKLLYTSGAVGGTCTLTLAQTSTPTAGFVKYAPSPVPLSGTGNTADTYGPFTYGADEIVQSAQSVNFVVSTSIDPHTTANTAGYLNVAFGTDADVVQVRLLPQTQTDTVRIFVDGVPVQATPALLTTILGGAVAAGNSHLLTITLGSSAPRKIRLEILNARFGGVFQGATYDFFKVPLHGPKVAVLGDSTSGGSAVNTGGGSGTWFNYACDLLGWENRWNQSRGGTGYITTNSPYTTLPNRVALDIVGKAFDVVIVDAGWNDASTDQTAFQTAVTNTISAIKAGLPKAWIVGVGCYSTSGSWPPYAASPTATPVASSVTKDAWQRTVFQAQGIPYISQITGEIRDASWNVADTIGPWMTGSGRVGVTSGFGTADRFLGDGASDVIHPNDLGHKAKGLWMATALRKLLAV